VIIEILKYTPKWVFGLLIFLIILGFKQSKDREVKKLMILPLPVGMAFLSFFGAYSSFGLVALPIGLWFIALAGISYVVAKYYPVKGVSYDLAKERFFIPGSWLPLQLMMAIFFTKYVVGILNALQPSIIVSTSFVISISLVYGIFSGIFAARAMSVWRVIRWEPVEGNT
jgi:hypothetical protein